MRTKRRVRRKWVNRFVKVNLRLIAAQRRANDHFASPMYCGYYSPLEGQVLSCMWDVAHVECFLDSKGHSYPNLDGIRAASGIFVIDVSEDATEGLECGMPDS